MRRFFNPKFILTVLAVMLIIGVLVWQGITSHGNPQAVAPKMSHTAGIVNTGILVFREGLEAILVLSAITAGLMRKKQVFWKPIASGAGVGFISSLITWFIVVAIISVIPASELNIQAATGLLAIVVLLIVMNWFFHKIYWTGWIGMHNKKKKQLIENADHNIPATYIGLALLGFSAVYREGFEIVLFLQDLRLKAGSEIILIGTSIGLFLTLIVAVLTFILQRKLPYKKMLVLTGVMLGAVLIVMVGESVQELQLASWLPTTALNLPIPGWMGMWFAVFPNVEGLVAQLLAAVFVLGSYFTAEHVRVGKRRKQLQASQSQ